MSANKYERGVLRDVFGMDPDKVDAGFGTNLSWCLLEYGELRSEYAWNEYADNCELDDGEIDELTYWRRRKKQNDEWAANIKWLKNEAWESLEENDG